MRETCFSARCCVCGQAFEVGDEVIFKITGPLSPGMMHYSRFCPLHEVCGRAHAQRERRRQQRGGAEQEVRCDD